MEAKNEVLDDVDLKILDGLEKNGRISWAELAETVGMSAPGILDRVRRLEERGVIHGYSVRTDAAALGLKLVSFVFLKLLPGTRRERFLELIERTPEIAECHHVTGTSDYLLRIYCLDSAHLERVLVDR